ncbi:hypothetical protein phiK7B1_156 [Pseudomonas phage phiK7B1]|nr:hypothetical protein phiK7B1_156 [Pseudomonas phage phiK7B1]
MSQNAKRLQALFEHCCLHTMKNIVIRQGKLDFAKDADGTYTSLETEDLYSLWLSGHGQGVVDHAAARGDVEL